MFRIGFAERIVNPPAGIWLGGFGSRTEPALGIRDDLRAQLIWLQSGAPGKGREAEAATSRTADNSMADPYEQQAESRFTASTVPSGDPLLLIVLDQVGLTREWTDALQARLQAEYGLAPQQILVHWTHTHCAPLYREPTPGFEHAVYSPGYFASLIDTVASLVPNAMADAEPVRLSHGSGRCDLAVSRRRTEDGRVPFSAADVFGTVDHEVPVLAAYRPDGSCKLVLFSYACHPTMTSGLFVSAEYPGVARRVIESRVPGARAVFLQGCGGDAIVGVHESEKVRYSLPDQWEDVDAAGRALAWKVLLTLSQRMEAVRGDRVSSIALSCYPVFEHAPSRAELEARAAGSHPADARWASYQLRRITGEPVWPASIEARLHGIRLGDLYLLGHPGEVVAAYGLRLKERHPRLRLIPFAYCHAQIGYIPRRSMYDEGGYEVDAWRTWGYPSRWDRGIEQLFESTAEQVLSRLQTEIQDESGR